MARVSRASVRHCRSQAPFWRGTCGEMVVRRMRASVSSARMAVDVRSPALSVWNLLTVTLWPLQYARYFYHVALTAMNMRDANVIYIIAHNVTGCVNDGRVR
eukprot:4833997-Pleurochrysis_carterae.AAC.2